MKSKNHNIRFNMEKGDGFAERIMEAVEKKVMSNLPALFGMYMTQMWGKRCRMQGICRKKLYRRTL